MTQQTRIRREESIEAFEAAWAQGLQPRIEDFLPSDEADRQEVLVELIHVELELRCKAGEEPRIDDYIARFPELASDPAVMKALLDAEAIQERTASYTPPRKAADGSAESICTIIAGKYKLLQRIGEGGMGTVWMADQLEPVKRRVAVKLIRAERDGSRIILTRFEAERQAIALMDHPHIAKLLDAGTDAGRPFFVMELVKGVPLNEFCDQHRLDIADRLRLFMQICSAVQHAHQKGIIHRDLKPSNILVESHDDKPVPKVIDFGLAKALSGQLLTENTLFTALGAVTGTPAYMAPEQATFNAVDIDTRADIYALGVVLYELLTGSTPIEREQLKKAAFDEILRTIREIEPQAPSKRLSSTASKPSIAASRRMEPAKLGRFLSGDLDWIVMKALSKERDRRYETANAFARDVERFLNLEPVLAGPPTAAYRLRKFVKRNKGPVLAASVLVLALVGGITGTTLGLLEARRQEGMAKTETSEKEKALESAEARRIEVEAEKKKVEEEQQVAQSELDFLTIKLLGQADVGAQEYALLRRGGLSGEARHNITIRELLDRAAEELTEDRIERNFPGQWKVQAELLKTVGEAYRTLQEYKKAIAFLERAAANYKEKLGADHPYTLATLCSLADCYELAGNLADGIGLYEKVSDASIKILGSDHPDTLSKLTKLGSAYLTAGRLPEAITLLEKVRDAQVKTMGADHRNTLKTLHMLAEAYRTAGKVQEAITLLEKVSDAQVKKLGEDHTDTLVTLCNLGLAYRDAGRLPEAITLLEKVRDLQVKKLEADHRDTLNTLTNLGLAYWAAGRLPEAISLFEKLRDTSIKKLGADHPNTFATLNNLGLAYRDAGRLPEAIALFEKARDAFIKKLGADHPDTLTMQNNLAEAYRRAGKVLEAITLFEKALNARVKRLGADHPDTLTTMRQLILAYIEADKAAEAKKLILERIALIRLKVKPESLQLAGELAVAGFQLLKLKQYAAAEPIVRESLAIREKAGPDAWTTFNTQSILGGALLGMKKYGEAEPLLLKGYEGMKAREKTIPLPGIATFPEAIDRLIDLYTAINKPDEVKKWQAEREKYRPTTLKPSEKK